SQVAAAPGPRFRILGDRAAFTKYGMDVQEDALIAGGRPTDAGWGEEPESLWGHLGTPGNTHAVKSEAGAYQRFYVAVLASLRDGTPPPVDPADSIAALDVIEAARRSAAMQQTVTMAAL
ncbi:MAG TPA: Gfo/Idh/MocA family oxidoreductase, partial [Ilumatobacteraceae bacterium]